VLGWKQVLLGSICIGGLLDSPENAADSTPPVPVVMGSTLLMTCQRWLHACGLPQPELKVRVARKKPV
jgi:hypothetical protein